MTRKFLSVLLFFSLVNATRNLIANNIDTECWPETSTLGPVIFKDCIETINQSLVPPGADPNIPLKFSKDLRLHPDHLLPNFWRSRDGDCIIGIDFEAKVGGYDRTSLNDIKRAALAIARQCVIPPPHRGGIVYPLGWQGKLGVTVGSFPPPRQKVVQE